MQLYINAPEITVKTALDNAEISAAATDCFGQTVWSGKSEGASKTLSVKLPGPDYYFLSAQVSVNGKVAESTATSLLVTAELPKDYYQTSTPAFGVWGGLDPYLRQVGGAKWDRQLFFTVFQKADFAGQAPDAATVAKREPVKIIRCLNVLSPFKKMVAVPADDWADILTKLDKEITSRRGLVDVWETQNEPMVGENFHGTMADVMDIIRHESAAVRRIDPGTPIAGVCINPMNQNQFNQYLGYYKQFQIERCIDGVMLHPYIPGAQSPDTSGYVDVLNRLSRELTAITGKHVPMYISEIGYSTKPGGEVTELQQAAYLARVMLLNFQIPDLKACVWHIGLWNEATSQRELDFGLLRKFEKGSPLRQPKPAYAAWATASRILYNAKYVGELNFNRKVRVLLFDKNGQPLLAAYSLVPEEVKFQLAVNSREANLTQVCGKTMRQTIDNGVLELTLTEAPVYIEAGSLDYFGGNQFQAEFTPTDWQVAPGAKLTAQIKIPASQDKGALTLQVVAPPEIPVTVTPLSNQSYELAITPDLNVKPGFYDLFLRLQANKENRYIWQKTLEVVAPVVLGDFRPDHQNGKGLISFAAHSNTGKAEKATVEIIENNRRTIALGEVATGDDTILQLHLPQAGWHSTYQAKITMPDRRSWQQTLPDDLAPLFIPRGSDPAATTGWPLADGHYSMHAVRGDYDKPEGTVKLSYDQEALYFDIAVKDKTLSLSKRDSIWNGDSLQIGISVPQKDMIKPNNDGIQETSYAEFAVNAAAAPQNSQVYASMNLNLMPLHEPVPGLRSNAFYEGEVIRYRLAVPWETLNIVPRDNLKLGISILVNDRDQGDRHWLEWYGGIADGKDPSRYGNAQLAK